MKKVTSIVANNFKNDSRVFKKNICFQKPEHDETFWIDSEKNAIKLYRNRGLK